MQHAPHAILGAVFVEPVVFLLSLRNVLDQFLYAPCDPVMELVRTDPGVARALRRDFWWMEAALWREQLGVGTLQSLSLQGCDCVSDEGVAATKLLFAFRLWCVVELHAVGKPPRS